MPELPDVQVFKEYLDTASLHQKVSDVEVTDAGILEEISSRGLTRIVKDQPLEETHRHGKHLFVRLEDGTWLHVHFGMTGRLLYNKSPDKKPEHARVVHRREESRPGRATSAV